LTILYLAVICKPWIDVRQTKDASQSHMGDVPAASDTRVGSHGGKGRKMSHFSCIELQRLPGVFVRYDMGTADQGPWDGPSIWRLDSRPSSLRHKEPIQLSLPLGPMLPQVVGRASLTANTVNFHFTAPLNDLDNFVFSSHLHTMDWCPDYVFSPNLH
jgi:hypothetical protein